MKFNQSILGDIASVGDGAHSKVKRVDDGVLYLTSKNIKKGFLDLEKVDYISNVDHNKLFSKSTSSVRHLEKNDILVGIIGTFGNIYQYSDEDYFGISSSIGIIRPNKEIINPNFLYYYLSSRYVERYIENIKGGSVQGYTNLSALRSIPIKYPENIAYQVKIVHILSSLDSKIDINNQMIDTLEEMASTLFKRWFVDFEFPDANGKPYKSSGGKMTDSELGEIPVGWEVTTLKKFSVNMKSGGTPSRKIEEYWEEGTIPWIKTKEINNNYIISSEEKITNLGLVNSSAKMIKPNSILIAMYGTTAGQLGFLTFPSSTNQACCSVESDFPMYTFLLLKNKQEYIKSLATGSAQQNLSKKVLEEIKIVVAENELLINFEDKCNFTKYINSLSLENGKIENIKNSLIPKLLSGEIGV